MEMKELVEVLRGENAARERERERLVEEVEGLRREKMEWEGRGGEEGERGWEERKVGGKRQRGGVGTGRGRTGSLEPESEIGGLRVRVASLT